MNKKDDIIAVRIEPVIRRQFQIHCEAVETTMSQELRRFIKQQLGIIKQIPPSGDKAEA